MSETVRNWIFAHPGLVDFFLRILSFLNPTNRIKGRRRNTIQMGCVWRRNCRIRIKGSHNVIEIEDYSRLINSRIQIQGNNNHIVIGKRCYLMEADLYLEDDGNEIRIGDHTSIDGKTHLAAIEGTKIIIGPDCMFSQNIHVRTGDAHSILDAAGQRINRSQNVCIGEHCWIGMDSTVLKGSVIGPFSIVGAGTIVSGKQYEQNCILAGVPGKVVRSNINWCRERIKTKEES